MPNAQDIVQYLVERWLPDRLSQNQLARCLASSLARPTTPWVAVMQRATSSRSGAHVVTWTMSNGDVLVRLVSPPCVSEDVAWGLASAQLMALAAFLRIKRLRVSYPCRDIALHASRMTDPSDGSRRFWEASWQLEGGVPFVSWHHP